VSIPPQPVLRDGEVVLRPCALDDAGAARVRLDRVDQEVAPGVVRFLVEHQARPAGTVEVGQEVSGNGELSWAVLPGHRGQGVGTRAVRLLIRYAFEELGLHRVVAYVEREDRVSLRIAGRVGLRREGVVRGCRQGGGHRQGEQVEQVEQGERGDYVQLARLATDPEPTSASGFIGLLNAGLPTKRVIAQGLIHNSAGEILLCELTYKQEWDLPGGVVEPHESPADAVVREIREEMQVEVSPRSLVAVNWLPPWSGWDDATLFVFELGVDDGVIARARLEPRELRALHWCAPDQVETRCAPYVTRMLRRLAQQTDGTSYLEDGAEPDWS
jgi:RimJ/RimL family protein N-acetyltransferase/ADP-ribose pyrophosphatase YjhB (NUDIX family)